MKPIITFLIAALAAFGAPALAQGNTPSATPAARLAPLPERLQAWFEPLVETRDFSGVIAVRRNGELIAWEAFGYTNWEAGTRFSTRTLFPAGTMTRSVTVALARGLIAADRLSPQDTLGRYLPELRHSDRVTLGQLMAHQAGLPARLPDGLPLDGTDEARLAWIDRIAPLSDTPQPAAESPLTYALLALVVERAAFARFETLATARYFSPFEMTATQIHSASSPRTALHATGYEPGPLPLDLRETGPHMALVGDTGMQTSLVDLMDWAEAIGERRIDLFNPDGTLAAGWRVEHPGVDVTYSVESRVPGFHAGLAVLPGRGLTIAWLNTVESRIEPILGETVRDLVLGNPVPAVAPRERTGPFEPSHHDAAGLYTSGRTGPVRIEPAEGGLDLFGAGGGEDGDFLSPAGTDRVLSRRLDARFAFVRDAAGRVAALSGEITGPDGTSQPVRLVRTDLPPLPEATDADGED